MASRLLWPGTNACAVEACQHKTSEASMPAGAFRWTSPCPCLRAALCSRLYCTYSCPIRSGTRHVRIRMGKGWIKIEKNPALDSDGRKVVVAAYPVHTLPACSSRVYTPIQSVYNNTASTL
jgi:hypothetical protein